MAVTGAVAASVSIDESIRRAEALIDVNRPAEALEILQSDSGTPHSADALATIGRAQIQLKNHYEALQATKAAAAVDPDSPLAFLVMAYAYRDLKNDQESLRCAKTGSCPQSGLRVGTSDVGQCLDLHRTIP